MSTYPVLNDRPIDQLTVTELKDELERRYLTVSGLKDDLLKRLFEAMQDEILDGEGKPTVVTSPPEEQKGGGTPGSIVASVNQASIEQHVDKGASEVAKQGTDLVISVTEAYDESTFPTSEVTQEAVGTAEATQKSLDAVAEVESSLVDTAATHETNGNGLDSASSGNTIVMEAKPHSEGHGDTIEKTPEDDTNKKMAVDEPSDLTGSDIKLGLDVHSKIQKLEDEPSPPDMKLHSAHEDSVAVAVAELEDDTSKKMIIDDVPPRLNVELGAKVDCKIEQEEVSKLFDATALHAYLKERIVPAAEGLVVSTAEASQKSLDAVAEVVSSLVDTAATDETNGNGLGSASSGNAIVKEANPHSEGHGDTIEKTPEDDTIKKMAVDEPSDLTGSDIKLGLDVHSKILKLEDEPAPPDMKLHSDHEDSDALAVAEQEDDTSKKMVIDDVPSSLTQANVELGAKVDCKIEQEEVSKLFDATALHAYPKERIVAAAEGLVDHVVGTAEASQRSLDDVAEVASSLVDTAATDETNGNGLDSASSGNTIVKGANPHSEGHGDTIEKTPEDDTNKKMAVDEPSDLTGSDIKLGLDVRSKILKLEDEPARPDMKLHSDHDDSDAVAVAELEDDTSKNMITDDVPSSLTHANVELVAKVDCKTEQEEVSTLFDATALHAYPKEHIVAAAEGLGGAAEASQKSLDDVAEVVSSLVNAAVTDETNGNGLDSTSSGNTTVKEAKPRSEGHGDTVEKTPEDDTNHKTAVDDEPTDETNGNGLDSTSSGNTTVKEANPHSEGHGNTVEKTPEDDNNNKTAVDDEPTDLTGEDIKLGLDVHSKILKLKDGPAPAPPDDMLHSDHDDSDAVAVAEPEDDTSQKMIIDVVPSGPTHTNVELGAKVDCKIGQEEVSILSDATALHAYPKEHIVAAAEGLALPRRTLMSGYTSNIDLDRKEESPDRNSREKLNLDRSSGDESMDEDVMESKHADSYIKPDDLRGKTEGTSEHVFKEVSLRDTHAEGLSAHPKEVVIEENLQTPTEKRKPEDQEVIENNEPIKRQRLWNKDAVNISDQQASKITSTGTQMEVICSASERSFGRNNTIARRKYPKERIVPPAKTSTTTSLRIDRFVRPFTLKAVQELLGKTGSVCSFWMDQIKTHCYVTYSSVEEAVATRNAVYNLQWPPNNNNYLIAEFVDPDEVKLKLETPPPSQVPISPSTVTALQEPEANQTLVPPRAPATSRISLPSPVPFAKPPPTSDPGPARESLPPPPPMNLKPARTLDELFKKTQAYPRIYYMPLSEEEVSAKRAAHNNGKRG